MNLDLDLFSHPLTIINRLLVDEALDYNTQIKLREFLKEKRYPNIKTPYEEYKLAPKDFFRAELYCNNVNEVIKHLQIKYKAIKSRYIGSHIFIPLENLEFFLDEFFENEELLPFNTSSLVIEKNIIWTDSILNKYKKIRDLYYNSKNPYIKWDFVLIEEFKDSLRWDNISALSNLKWSTDNLKKYRNFILFDNSKNHHINLKIRLDLLKNIKWSSKTIEILIDDWDWSELCLNEKIKWDKKLIQKFYSRIDFSSLSSNKKIEWSEELILQFFNDWNWENLSGNPSLNWSYEFILKYENKWKWKPADGSYYHNEYNDSPSLSTNSGITWSNKMIKKWKDKIDIWRICLKCQLKDEVLFKYKKELSKMELVGWLHDHKIGSMYGTSNKVQCGWDNLSLNVNFKLNEHNIEFLFKTIIKFEFNNKDGRDSNHNLFGINSSSKLRLIELFCYTIINDFSFVEKSSNSDFIISVFYNKRYINECFWLKIVRPYLLKNKKKFIKIAEIETIELDF